MAHLVTPSKGNGRSDSDLRDARAGWTKIPSTGGFRRSSCCCHDPKGCKKISMDWIKIGDFRGQMLRLPTVSDSSRNQGQQKTKKGRMDRIKVHLSNDISPSVDNRVRTQEQPRPRRNAPKEAKRQDTWIAAHHFDPIVLRKVGNSDTVQLEFLKENKLWNNAGYTDADKVKHLDGMCYVVPSYSMESTKFDLAHVRQEDAMEEMVATVVQERRGMYQTRSTTPTDSAEEGSEEKRQRLSTGDGLSRTELEALVCRLHEKVENLMKNGPPVEMEGTASGADSNEEMEAFLKKKNAPLSRLAITSDVFHRNNPHVAKLLFGFEDTRKKEDLIQQGKQPKSSWEITKQVLWLSFNVKHKEPTMERVLRADGKNKKLSAFEESILTLLWMENDFNRDFLAVLFGVHRNVVGQVIIRWAPVFGKIGCDMARLKLTKGFLDKSYPQSYIDMGFAQNVMSIIDGSDVHMQTSRVDRAVLVCQSSNKTGGSAARGITWSTPMGLVHEFTDLFFGRASEKSLVSLWAKHGRLRDLPVGYVMLGDKGFDQTSGCYHNFIPVIHPAFLKKGMQFTEEQLEWNRRACELRYTCEVVFSRVKKRGNLAGIIDRSEFPYLRDIWAWAHGRANLYQPLQRPANDGGYFSDSKYQKKKN